MNQTNKYVIIIALFLFVSCTNREAMPFQVAYEVKLLAPATASTKIWISFVDSTGSYVTFHTTEKEWRKEVALPPDQNAWLFVMIMQNNQPEPQLGWFDKRKKRPLISGKITHAKKTVEKYDPELVSISLHKIEIDAKK